MRVPGAAVRKTVRGLELDFKREVVVIQKPTVIEPRMNRKYNLAKFKRTFLAVEFESACHVKRSTVSFVAL